MSLLWELIVVLRDTRNKHKYNKELQINAHRYSKCKPEQKQLLLVKNIIVL